MCKMCHFHFIYPPTSYRLPQGWPNLSLFAFVSFVRHFTLSLTVGLLCIIVMPLALALVLALRLQHWSSFLALSLHFL